MDEYMKIAVQEAKAAQDAGDFPYGSVLVRGGTIIGIGRSIPFSNPCPGLSKRNFHR